MRKQYGAEAEPYPHTDKKEHQGDTGHDLRIQHGYVGDSHHNGAVPFFHAVDGDAGDGSDTGGNGRGKKGYQQRIVQRFQYNAVLEQLIIPFQSKTAPFGPCFAGIEGKDHQRDDRGIQENKNKGDIYSLLSLIHI